jgi:hypothetical protein
LSQLLAFDSQARGTYLEANPNVIPHCLMQTQALKAMLLLIGLV